MTATVKTNWQFNVILTHKAKWFLTLEEMLGYFNPNIDKHSNWVNILNDFFKFEFVHILPKIGLKQPSIF